MKVQILLVLVLLGCGQQKVASLGKVTHRSVTTNVSPPQSAFYVTTQLICIGEADYELENLKAKRYRPPGPGASMDYCEGDVKTTFPYIGHSTVALSADGNWRFSVSQSPAIGRHKKESKAIACDLPAAQDLKEMCGALARTMSPARRIIASGFSLAGNEWENCRIRLAPQLSGPPTVTPQLNLILRCRPSDEVPMPEPTPV